MGEPNYDHPGNSVLAGYIDCLAATLLIAVQCSQQQLMTAMAGHQQAYGLRQLCQAECDDHADCSMCACSPH